LAPSLRCFAHKRQHKVQRDSATTLKTPWAEPDLQGIWTNEFDTPLQRPAKYADQEFFTEVERAELDKQRSETLADLRAEHGTEADVAGGDNSVGKTRRRTGERTSLIADPPNGQIPPMTPEAQKAAAADREFALALLQATRRASPRGCSAKAGNTIRRPRRDVRSILLATTRGAAGVNPGPLNHVTIATMGRRMVRWTTAV
jgi:hypothetical protein